MQNTQLAISQTLDTRALIFKWSNFSKLSSSNNATFVIFGIFFYTAIRISSFLFFRTWCAHETSIRPILGACLRIRDIGITIPLPKPYSRITTFSSNRNFFSGFWKNKTKPRWNVKNRYSLVIRKQYVSENHFSWNHF